MSLGRGSVSPGTRLIVETAVVSQGAGKLDGTVTGTWGRTILLRSGTRCPRGTCIAVSIRSCVGFQYASALKTSQYRPRSFVLFCSDKPLLRTLSFCALVWAMTEA